MAELNFPASSFSPWTDPNGQIWVHDGDGWIPNANTPDIYFDTAPVVDDYESGQGWVRTTDMVKFQLYEDADSKQWVQIGFQATTDLTNVNDNILHNGDLKIDQRGGHASWKADRWHFDNPPTGIYQLIEGQNLVDGADVVLSWEGGGDGFIEDKDGNIIGSGPSPVTVKILAGTEAAGSSRGGSVYVDVVATNIKLEFGTIPTAFVPRDAGAELALCQRYYWKTSSGLAYFLYARDTSPSTRMIVTVTYPVSMRVVPIPTHVLAQGLQIEYTRPTLTGCRYETVYTGVATTQITDLTFDADL